MNQLHYDQQRNSYRQPQAMTGGLRPNQPLQFNQGGIMGGRGAPGGGSGGMQRYFSVPEGPAPATTVPNPGQPPGPNGPAGPPGPTPEEIINLWRRNTLPREAPPPLPPRVAPIAPIDDSEAWRATYGRAKETAGNQARRGLDALMEMQGARGILGGGLGVGEIGSNILGPALNQLGDVNRQLAEKSYDAEVDRQKTNYQGGINQRSQDISHHQGVFGGNINQRGQDYNLLPIIRSLFQVKY